MSVCQLVTGTPATGNINGNTVTTIPGTPYAPSGAWVGTLYAGAFGSQFTSGTSVLGMYMTITTTSAIGTPTPALQGTASGVQAFILYVPALPK
jgi:hypothetical protein